MVDSPTQASSGGQGVHLVLYDGVCGLCNRLLQFLLAVDDRAVFDFASLQSPTGRALVERAGGHPDDLNSFYVSANYRTPGARVITKTRLPAATQGIRSADLEGAKTPCATALQLLAGNRH